jgi:hypothetical protein
MNMKQYMTLYMESFLMESSSNGAELDRAVNCPL